MIGSSGSQRGRFLLQLRVFVSLICISTGTTVYLSIDSNTVSDPACPDDLFVKIHLAGRHEPLTSLLMKLINHFDNRGRAYTVRFSDDGSYVIEDKESKRCRSDGVGYYHDVENDAHMKVTRTEDGPVMAGTLTLDGRRYKLFPQPGHQGEEWTKRGAGQAYNLVALDEDTPALRRTRRATNKTQEIYVDITGVADYASYKHFLSIFGDRDKAKAAMNKYYAIIIFSADLRYRSIRSTTYNINLRLNNLVILETSEASSFIDTLTNGNILIAAPALEEFKKYAKQDKNKVLYPSDHIMLFTAYNLSGPNSSEEAKLRGKAYVGTVCQPNGQSLSIIEDDRGYQLVSDTVAHEIGHSLSAGHDGKDNPCEAEDLYLMTPIQTTSNKKKGRTKYFSQCSIKSFTNHITKLLSTKTGTECLLKKLPSNNIPDVSGQLPGQKYTPDQQCNLIKMDDSWCRHSKLADPVAELCTKMGCGKFVNGLLHCEIYNAALGTSCGPGKMCINEDCVSDSRAPKNVDNCAFGDQPGHVVVNRTCAVAVREDKSYCEETKFKRWCCATCREINKTGNPSSSNTNRNPIASNTHRDPPSSNTNRNPSTSNTRNPRSSNTNRNPSASNTRNPRSPNNHRNPSAFSTNENINYFSDNWNPSYFSANWITSSFGANGNPNSFNANRHSIHSNTRKKKLNNNLHVFQRQEFSNMIFSSKRVNIHNSMKQKQLEETYRHYYNMTLNLEAGAQSLLEDQ